VSDKKPIKKKVAPKKAKKTIKVTARGVAHIQSTSNNTIVTIADEQGNVVSQSSPGRIGYKGSRKQTPFAAQQAALAAATVAKERGMQSVRVEIKGPGQGRETSIRAMAEAGLTVTEIKDVSPIPHNGCRPPKRRRI